MNRADPRASTWRRARCSTLIPCALAAAACAEGPRPAGAPPASAPPLEGERKPATPSGRRAFAEHAVERASQLVDAGAHAEAARELQGAVQLEPGNRRARVLLGNAWIELGRFEEAREELRAAIEIKDGAPSRRALARSYLRQRQSIDEGVSGAGPRADLARAAVAELRKALGLAPREAEVRHDLGVAYRLVGDARRSAAMLERLTREHPERVDSLYELSLAYAALGDAERARATLRAVVELAPAHEAARRELERIEAASAGARE